GKGFIFSRFSFYFSRSSFYFPLLLYIRVCVCVDGFYTLLSGLPGFSPVDPLGHGVRTGSRVEPDEIPVRVWNLTKNKDHSFNVVFHVLAVSVLTEKIMQAAFEPDTFIF
ncbi:unnamed protein product, partial [marine sediment metagenome]